MKVFTISGVSGSGKTTTAEKRIAELRRRGYTVGSVKDIHFEGFAIDTPGSNTWRHREAGSQLVVARGPRETDILLPERLSLTSVLRYFDHMETRRGLRVPLALLAPMIEETKV